MIDLNSSKIKVTLNIANLAISVICDENALQQQLVLRYDQFLSTVEANLNLYISLSGEESNSGIMDAELTYQEGIVQFDKPGCHGYIDIHNGIGELLLPSNRPFEDVDYSLRVVYALLAFQVGGLLFHASGIVRQGWTYLFFGHSGSGKTTVARLSTSDIVLNDDLVLMLPSDEGWMVYATPFWNPTQVFPSPLSAPAKLMMHLVQDKKVFVEPIGQGQALAEMVSCVPVVSGITPLSNDLLTRCSEILGKVPMYNLHFLPDDSFWGVVESLG